MAVAVVRWGALRDRPADLRGAHAGPARPVALRPGGRRRRGVPPGGHRDPRGVVGPAGRRLRGGPDDRRPLVRARPAPARHASPATASRSASTTPTPPRARAMLDGLQPGRARGCPSSSCGSGRSGRCCEDPSDLEIADAFGLLTPLDTATVYDLVVVGSGPAGLGRQRLRRLRGPEHARARARGDRRAGRHQFDDPQLSRLQGRASAATGWPSAPTCRPGPSAARSTSCARRQGITAEDGLLRLTPERRHLGAQPHRRRRHRCRAGGGSASPSSRR